MALLLASFVASCGADEKMEGSASAQARGDRAPGKEKRKWRLLAQRGLCEEL
jgi:hypothetical protein